MSSQIVFITGCSKGFGRALVEVARTRGYTVVATARQPGSVADLAGPDVLALALDVTNNDQVQSAVAAALDRFGRIDVLINNAGFGIGGAIEEISDTEVRRVFDTNVFGLLNVTRAVLPAMRRQRSGRILNISSIGGLDSTIGGGIYCSSKFALEGLSESLAMEVAPLGIRVTLVEPGPFRTDFLGGSFGFAEARIDDYAETVGKARENYRNFHGKQPGDPLLAAQAMLDVAAMEQPPLRLPLGSMTIDRLRAKLKRLEETADQWEKVARAADGAGT
jgi:NAD(P)-dependent dehydrogenase (short-subunit alcohol dehydrogenase family)